MVDFSLTEDDLKLLIAANAHLGSKNTNVRFNFIDFTSFIMSTVATEIMKKYRRMLSYIQIG